MQENYSKQKQAYLDPNPETISFLLNYSKGFKVLKSKSKTFEVFIN
jgi:ADP-dependent phosphofructokinase/glucokinase